MARASFLGVRGTFRGDVTVGLIAISVYLLLAWLLFDLTAQAASLIWSTLLGLAFAAWLTVIQQKPEAKATTTDRDEEPKGL